MRKGRLSALGMGATVRLYRTAPSCKEDWHLLKERGMWWEHRGRQNNMGDSGWIIGASQYEESPSTEGHQESATLGDLLWSGTVYQGLQDDIF